MNMSTTLVEADVYNAYRWTKLVQLYLNRHKLLREDIAYRGFDILLALDAAHFMGRQLSTSDLCAAMNGPTEEVLDAVLKLERSGLIKRTGSTDPANRETLQLTPKGLRIMQWGYRRLFRIVEVPSG